MYISNIHISNFRNFREVNVKLQRKTILLGENNSGKTNLMLALTLPLSASEVGLFRKKIGWNDINKECRDNYVMFIRNHLEALKTGSISPDEILPHIPTVIITLTFSPDDETDDRYYLKKLLSELTEANEVYTLRYRFYLKNVKDLLNWLKDVLNSSSYDEKIVNSLLPIHLYETEITNGNGDKPISFSDLQNFVYSLIPAERDDFSGNIRNIGSKLFVGMLTKKLNGSQKSSIEKGYNEFFDSIRTTASIDNLINWQNYSEVENSREFFTDLELQPNMPDLFSILNSARLGMKDRPLSGEGLGHRNLLFLAVLLNAMSSFNDGDPNFSLLLIEEPDAHLSQSSQLVLNSFLETDQLQNSTHLQLIFDTHGLNFIDKTNLANIVILSEGMPYSLFSLFMQEELDYLSRNPNTDIYSFLFSKRVIMVEGLSEELLIRAHKATKRESLHRTTVLSFHKGFKNAINVWRTINNNNGNKLAVIRDFDNQQNAQKEHEALDNDNVRSFTTHEYTLEDEILSINENYIILNDLFSRELGWENIDSTEALTREWKKEKLTPMLTLCKAYSSGNLTNFELPDHIKKALEWLGD